VNDCPVAREGALVHELLAPLNVAGMVTYPAAMRTALPDQSICACATWRSGSPPSSSVPRAA
jgi:hypothetical protein